MKKKIIIAAIFLCGIAIALVALFASHMEEVQKESQESFLPIEEGVPTPFDSSEVIYDEFNAIKIVANRINVLLESDSLSIEQFASDFKSIYRGKKYKIVYYNRDLNLLQLQVPKKERSKIKNELIDLMPVKYNSENVLVFDEPVLQTNLKPNDAKLGECWYHSAIRSNQAWEITMGNENLIIAVVDDGFEITHEELANKIVSPYNVYDKSSDVKESKSRHGTHVAGLIAATANNGKGIAGVAPKCKIMPIKVFNGFESCSSIAVLQGVLYAIKNNANVVNLSLGMIVNERLTINQQKDLISNHYRYEEHLWERIFNIADSKKSTVVIAAGNDNILAGIDPKHRSEDVIVVAAIGKNNLPMYDKAEFSNYGIYTDVSAPGQDILSTVGVNQYEEFDGTSMAAPLVSGAVALMKSVDSNLNTRQIKSILQETGLSVDLNIGKLIQLDKAIVAVKQRVKNGDKKDSKPQKKVDDEYDQFLKLLEKIDLENVERDKPFFAIINNTKEDTITSKIMYQNGGVHKTIVTLPHSGKAVNIDDNRCYYVKSKFVRPSYKPYYSKDDSVFCINGNQLILTYGGFEVDKQSSSSEISDKEFEDNRK